MPTQDQQSNLANAIAQIRNAQTLLQQQIDIEVDTRTAAILTNKHIVFGSYLSSLLQTQNLSDDASFTGMAQALQKQDTALKAESADIQALVADVKTAASIVGYITQALIFVAKL